MNAQRTVYLVENDESVRDSVSETLSTHGYSVHAYATASSFLEHYAEGNPSCLLIDVRLPDQPGVEVLSILAERGDPNPVVMLCGFADVPVAVKALKIGAHDFLCKPLKAPRLLGAVESSFSSNGAKWKCDATPEEIRSRLERLTPRERQVLGLVTNGLSSRQVAAELGVSFKTIEAHRAKVMTKTCAEDVAHLVRMCLSESGIEPLSAAG